MIRNVIIVVLLLALCGVVANAADQKVIPRNAKVYVADMDNDLDGYIRAEIIKKKVPVVIVLKEDEADFILTGFSAPEEKRKWHEGWLTVERDHASANIALVDKSGKLLWASEAGDRSIWWGALKRGGQRQVANRLVNNLKKIVM